MPWIATMEADGCEWAAVAETEAGALEALAEGFRTVRPVEHDLDGERLREIFAAHAVHLPLNGCARDGRPVVPRTVDSIDDIINLALINLARGYLHAKLGRPVAHWDSQEIEDGIDRHFEGGWLAFVECEEVAAREILS